MPPFEAVFSVQLTVKLCIYSFYLIQPVYINETILDPWLLDLQQG